MQTQKWTRNTKHGKETITCEVEDVRVKRGREIKDYFAIKSAMSDRMGRMLVSSPMMQDIQEAITQGKTVSRSWGFRKEA